MIPPNGCVTIARAVLRTFTSPCRRFMAAGSSSTSRVSMQVTMTIFLLGKRSVAYWTYSLTRDELPIVLEDFGEGGHGVGEFSLDESKEPLRGRGSSSWRSRAGHFGLGILDCGLNLRMFSRCLIQNPQSKIVDLRPPATALGSLIVESRRERQAGCVCGCGGPDQSGGIVSTC